MRLSSRLDPATAPAGLSGSHGEPATHETSGCIACGIGDGSSRQSIGWGQGRRSTPSVVDSTMRERQYVILNGDLHDAPLPASCRVGFHARSHVADLPPPAPATPRDRERATPVSARPELCIAGKSPEIFTSMTGTSVDTHPGRHDSGAGPEWRRRSQGRTPTGAACGTGGGDRRCADSGDETIARH